MTESLPPSARVQDFLDRMRTQRRARVSFILDATGSREKTWDLAAKLQAEMFTQAAAFGTLDLQLVFFRGTPGVKDPAYKAECAVSRWTGDGQEMARLMAKIRCRVGPTQYQRALQHARKEHQQQSISACVIIGDMCEEYPQALYDAVASLSGVPCFVFGEGDDPIATPIFREMARLSNGAYARFDAGSAHQLAELLKAVAVFATGGLTALSNLKTEASVKLLTQMKKKD
jgi:hypothetical protein